MRHVIGLVVAVGFGLGACASHSPSSAPVPKLGAVPVSHADKEITVGADPYVDRERQKAVFDADLAGERVLPIQVLVENGGDRRVVVRKADILLELDDGRQIVPTSASAVAATKEGIGGVIGWGIAFGIIGMLAASANEESARAARLEDYRQKELRDATLDKGASVHGFVYFMPAKGTPPFDRATLAVRVFEPATLETTTFRLPLTRLGFKGRDVDVATAAASPTAATPTATTASASTATPTASTTVSTTGSVVAFAPPPAPAPAAAPTTGSTTPAAPPVVAAVPDARQLYLGPWGGTLVLPNLTLDRNQPVALQISEEGGSLRWSLTGSNARTGIKGGGSASATEDGLTLSGQIEYSGVRLFTSDFGRGGRQGVTFTLSRRGPQLEGSGVSADNSTMSLALRRAR